MSQTAARPNLFKFITKNENWVSSDGKLNTISSYVDYQNRTLMKRSFVKNTSGNTVSLDTYYIYDDFGNLVYVLTPESDPGSQGGVSQTSLDKYCYQYKYDALNRMIEKKEPGKAKEYFVYNKLGQVVMSQDGELRNQNKWMFTKYDNKGRIIYTGIVNSSSSRTTHQNNANNENDLFETRNTNNSISVGGAQVFYSNIGYPSSNISEVLTINYYDSYPQGYTSIPSQNSEGQVISNKVKGLLTVSRVKILDESPIKWITTKNAYDKYGRLVWQQTGNDLYQSGHLIEHKLDFDGSILGTKIHQDHFSEDITIHNDFSYDHLGRVTLQTQKIEDQEVELIKKNTYDELGRLLTKEVGGGFGSSSSLQDVDYKYNVRGWLTSINDVGSLGSDLFALDLNYQSTQMGVSGVNGLYNGNISETIWRTANTDSYGSRKRGYAYKYDKLSRLKNAYFRRANSSGTSFNEQTNHYNVSNLSYDYNGNIKSLTRRGYINSSGSFGNIDQLSYTYDGNQLMQVSESGNKTEGFGDGSSNSSFQYSYDDNGNLEFALDKGIQSISYNYLNLPKTIFVQSNGYDGFISYKYAADGSKIEEFREESNLKRQYSNGFIYENGTFKYFNFSEGYVKRENGVYKYVYNFTDHLGNIRLSYSDSDGDGIIEPSQNEIIDEKNYYPFGLQHSGYNEIQIDDYNFGYVGKEKNTIAELLDFGPRFYHAELGKFLNFDPLATDEKQISLSPYAYSWNNPAALSDPSGLIPGGDFEKNDKEPLLIPDRGYLDGPRAGEMMTFYGGGFSFDGSTLTVGGSSKPSDWIKVSHNGKTYWVDTSGKSAQQYANMIGGEVIGKSFWGTESDEITIALQMFEERISYLNESIAKLNKELGIDPMTNGINITGEFLRSVFFNVSFGKGSKNRGFNLYSAMFDLAKSEAEGWIIDELASHINKTAGKVTSTMLTTWEMNPKGSSARDSRRAEAVEKFKNVTLPYIKKKQILLKIFEHKY